MSVHSLSSLTWPAVRELAAGQAIAAGDAHCEAAAGRVDALNIADASRMASLIIMGQLHYCGKLRCLLWLQRIVCANVLAGFGMLLLDWYMQDEAFVFFESPDTARKGCSVLHMQIHYLCRRHHIVVQIRHNQK